MVVASNSRVRRYWQDNIRFLDRNIPLGFIDADKVPNLNRYPIVKKVNQTMWELQ